MGDARTADPVTNIDAFSHGVVGSIEFAYELPTANVARFDANSARQLSPEAFCNGVFTSYACRTGLGNPGINIFRVPGFEGLQQEFSLAQTIASSAMITVKAFASRSDYANTLSSSKDRLQLKLAAYGISLSGPTMSYSEWKTRLNNRETIDGATFDPEGAVHPVEGGTTPVGVSGEQKIFTPK